MADREKVIGGLAACAGEPDDCAGHTCPYWDFDDSVVDHGCRIQMELDALDLLKEQEAEIDEIANKYLDLSSEMAKQPEIVRCKYCKHSSEWYGDKRRCFLWTENGIDVFEDGYCSYGRPKERKLE